MQLHQVQLFLPVIVSLFLDGIFFDLFMDIIDRSFFILPLSNKEIRLIGSIFAIKTFSDRGRRFIDLGYFFVLLEVGDGILFVNK